MAWASSRLVIHPPIMLLPEPQHLPNLPVNGASLSPISLTISVRGSYSSRNSFVGTSVVIVSLVALKTWKPQPVLLDRQMADLAQIPGVDVAPRIPLPGLGPADVGGEVAGVFVGFDHVADAEGVDVVVEAAGEGAGEALAAQLAAGVCVRGVDVVAVFVQGEGTPLR